MHSHSHHHGHDHSHGHHHHPVPTNINKAFIVGIILNFAFVVGEVVVGLYINSLSLLSDAGHNLADVGALSLSLISIRLQKVTPNNQYTYGLQKTSILTALFNAIVLIVSVGVIVFQAVGRFFHPVPIRGDIMLLVALLGIVINVTTGLMFLRDKDKDLNIKSAYMHLLSDAVVSFGIVITGGIIYYTGWSWLDPAISIILAVVILMGTWNILQESLRMSVDGVPMTLDIDKIRKAIEAVAGVISIHHLHVWAMSTTQNAMTAHVLVTDGTSLDELNTIKKNLKHALVHENIQHSTLEFETNQWRCDDEGCFVMN